MMQQGQLFGEGDAPAVISTAAVSAVVLRAEDYLTSRDNLMLLLNQWLAADWIRALDVALVKLLAQLEPDAQPLVLLATALVSHQLGHGHICLDLHSLLRDPDLALLLPPEGRATEEQLMLPSELLAAVSLSRWLDNLQHSHLVCQQAETATKPLALVAERLYLYRYWQYESRVAEQLVRRIDTKMPLAASFPERLADLFSTPLVVAGQRQTDWQKVACAMAAQGPLTLITGGPGTGKTTTVVRLLALLQQGALEVGQALRIQLAAPTGKAAARLTESIGQQVADLPVAEDVKSHIPTEVTTLHRLLGSLPDTRHFRYNSTNPLVVDVLVIDEASMIDLEMMHDVLQALPKHARLILLGDKDQLASVEAGSVLGDLCADAERAYYTPNTQQQLEQLCNETLHAEPWCVGNEQQHRLAQRTVMLRYSRRFGSDSGIGQLARAVNEGQTQRAWELLHSDRADIRYVLISQTTTTALDNILLNPSAYATDTLDSAGYAYYLQVLQQQRPTVATSLSDPCWEEWASSVLKAFDQFRLLCALRKGEFGVAGLNERIAHALCAQGLISNVEGWYEGRPVLVTKNDYSLGLMNGDIGIAMLLPNEDATADEHAPKQVLRVVFPRNDGLGRVRYVLPSRLTAVETVFAMTVHKSQGSEFVHTALILPDRLNPVLTKELLYTGITRARNTLTLIEGHSGIFSGAVQRKVERISGLNQAILAIGD